MIFIYESGRANPSENLKVQTLYTNDYKTRVASN